MLVRMIFSALTVALFSSVSLADITWNFTYNDVVNSTGVGFDDATHGAARRSTFNSVGGYLNSVLDETGVVDFTIEDSQTDGTGFLASAGTLYFVSPNGFTNGLLFEHATTGIDPSGGNNDGSARFDFGYTWNSELDTTTGSEFDLFTVSLHEITHAMGFSALMKSNGESAITNSNPGVYGVYASFLERGDGTALFSSGGNFDGNAGDTTSDDLYFGGVNAVAANGGNAVKIYAPGTYSSGSSISHVDTNTYPDSLMTHSVARGVEKRQYAAIDQGILMDIGWNFSAVPEPSSAMMICVGLGVMMSRRNRVRRR
ncbi:MAG: PEP-CTERM sorting domain-containing protein [Pirellulales bacterium]|jgi:hypothetical protein